jgi:hypothetical protein
MHHSFSRTSRIRDEIATPAMLELERFEELTDGACFAFESLAREIQIKGAKPSWTECW